MDCAVNRLGDIRAQKRSRGDLYLQSIALPERVPRPSSPEWPEYERVIAKSATEGGSLFLFLAPIFGELFQARPLGHVGEKFEGLPAYRQRVQWLKPAVVNHARLHAAEGFAPRACLDQKTEIDCAVCRNEDVGLTSGFPEVGNLLLQLSYKWVRFYASHPGAGDSEILGNVSIFGIAIY
ncbi:hypothetical protein ARMGADRAFT_1034928 [Armillaria gallica]|uniref:Uncharacterized protein n=1 Tax=Armillaria gallica TaxID=47427 RepID=A0A2H3CWH3_ARMGA|nr:hypothetical protein ARMGADRAFT_1034928 [Armillaria gallica]